VIGNVPTSQQEAVRAFERIREIVYILALNGGGMESELKEVGAVKGGDDCLYGAAIGLQLIADIFPSPIDQRRTEARAIRFYRALLEYYPDSRWAARSRSALDELT